MVALVRELSPESKIDALKNALAISAQKSLINTVDTEPKVTEALKDYGLSEKLVSQEKINQENLRRSEQIEHAKKIASELSQKASKEVHATIMEKAYRNPELTAISHQKLSKALLSAMHIGVVQNMQNALSLFTPPQTQLQMQNTNIQAQSYTEQVPSPPKMETYFPIGISINNKGEFSIIAIKISGTFENAINNQSQSVKSQEI
jgi:hypothetical protein